MTKDQAIDEIKRYIYECDDNALSVEAGEMAISALKESRPKGEWEIFGFPTSDDILYCQEEFICSECRDFKVNRYMRATYNFCPNCGADMRGKAE